MNYRYKKDSDIDAYGDTQNVIHFKFGDMRKMYHFTPDFQTKHPRFCEEWHKYWMGEDSLFSDPLAVVNYIETFDLPVRLYSNFVDEEFEDFDAVREWLNNEYQGQHKDKLYKYHDRGYIGLDGEKRTWD